VHRLDRDTSGLLVLAKSAAAKSALQAQFRSRTVAKTYQLLTIGHPEPAAAVIRLPTTRHPTRPLQRTVSATGRDATTRYRTLTVYPGYSLIEAQPETGRTHQIRVHFAAIGHPVAGDTTYGPARRPLHLQRQFLHAAQLQFTTPSGQTLHLRSPLPPDLATVLARLEKQV
jgi:23S rRNA pseudouridine1911/1915/1917 synthase